MRARVVDSAEHAPIWARKKEAMPMFAEYEAKTDREIPMVVLEPR